MKDVYFEIICQCGSEDIVLLADTFLNISIKCNKCEVWGVEGENLYINEEKA